VFDIAAPEVTGDYLNESDQRRVLEDALMKLPPAQRVPLVLYHFEEKSYDEISRSLNISLSKVKTDIFRGREALTRKLLRGGAAEEVREEYSSRSDESNRKNPLDKLHRALSPVCP
jgi:RNA polymerase sigma-70 factor (ECF subfamily)